MQYNLKLLPKITNFKINNFLFITGVFFIPSSLFIALIFLLPSFLLGSYKRENYFFDKYNCFFFLSGLLILISAILQNFIIDNRFKDIYNPYLSFVGLSNWIPFFWIFWAAQPYLNNEAKRKLFAIALIFGTFPVLITGFGQYFFNWYGPFEIFNGLIIWYQKPIIEPGGLSGLFSNQNYAGTWLNFVWPLCIALILEKKDGIKNQFISFTYLLSVGFAAFLTNSRNAWAGLITSFLILFGKKRLFWSLPILLFLSFFIFLGVSPIFPSEIQEFISNFVPEHILMEFSDEGYVGLDVTRMEILLHGIRLITLRPVFGFGAASFSSIFEFQTSFWKGHSHNLLVELAVSYGLPVTIIIFLVIMLLLIKSGKIIFLNKGTQFSNNIFDKALWTSIFFFCISQLVDIQYFDGKISIVAWLLLSSLKSINDNYKRERIYS